MSRAHILTPTRAKFRIFHNNRLQTIYLKPNVPTQFHSHTPTDEGFTSTWTEYTLVTDPVLAVTCQTATTSRDCDGPHDHVSTHVWTGGLIDNFYGQQVPDWELITQSQRDHFAEAMGY